MAGKTIYTSYITLNGKPATDFLCYQRGNPVWALQSVDTEFDPCEDYRVWSRVRRQWETVTMAESLNYITGVIRVR